MELIKSKTFENLKKAFIAECSARTRYEFVEYGQRYNGNEAIATIIDKIAYQEFNHARMLYTKIQSATKGTIDSEESVVTLPYRQKWDLLDNLLFTAEDEENEAVFYKKAAKTAKEEGFDDIAELFELIRKVELKHKKVLLYLHDKLKDQQVYKSNTSKTWVCPSCGNEMKGEKAPETCTLCHAKMTTFEINLPQNVVI